MLIRWEKTNSNLKRIRDNVLQKSFKTFVQFYNLNWRWQKSCWDMSSKIDR